MNLIAKLTVTFLAVAICVDASQAATILFFDFGNAAYTTPGNYNNITTSYPDIVTSITNAIDSTGAATPIDLTAGAFYSGIRFPTGGSTTGTTTPTGDAAIFDPQATRDYSYGFPGDLSPSYLQFRDLNPNVRYELTIFASTGAFGSSYQTQYIVDGQNSMDTVYLEPAGNQSNVAVVSNVAPNVTTNGIDVYLSPGPNNNNLDHVYIIGALRLVEVSIPEPVSSTLIVFGAFAMLSTRRHSCRL